jgi:hypothetical protein
MNGAGTLKIVQEVPMKQLFLIACVAFTACTSNPQIVHPTLAKKPIGFEVASRYPHIFRAVSDDDLGLPRVDESLANKVLQSKDVYLIPQSVALASAGAAYYYVATIAEGLLIRYYLVRQTGLAGVNKAVFGPLSIAE